MKIHKYNEMMKWLTRPKENMKYTFNPSTNTLDSADGKENILDYIERNNYLYGNGKKPTEASRTKNKDTVENGKIIQQLNALKEWSKNPKLYYEKHPPKEASPAQMDRVRKQTEYMRAMEKPKSKKVAKASSLVSPQKPLPLKLDKWLDEIHPQWWEHEYDRPIVDEDLEAKRIFFESLVNKSLKEKEQNKRLGLAYLLAETI